jgi:hypothetical protein
VWDRYPIERVLTDVQFEVAAPGTQQQRTGGEGRRPQEATLLAEDPHDVVLDGITVVGRLATAVYALAREQQGVRPADTGQPQHAHSARDRGGKGRHSRPEGPIAGLEMAAPMPSTSAAANPSKHHPVLGERDLAGGLLHRLPVRVAGAAGDVRRPRAGSRRTAPGTPPAAAPRAPTHSTDRSDVAGRR